MTFGTGPIKVVEKLWGTERWYVNEPEYCMKLLTVKPGFACSLHYHPIKKETFICTGADDGELLLELAGETFNMKSGDSVLILPNTPHRFSNRSQIPCTIIEVSTHHSDDDVVRLEPSKAL